MPSSQGCLSLSRCLSTGLCVPGALERMTKQMNNMVGGLGDLLGITGLSDVLRAQLGGGWGGRWGGRWGTFPISQCQKCIRNLDPNSWTPSTGFLPLHNPNTLTMATTHSIRGTNPCLQGGHALNTAPRPAGRIHPASLQLDSGISSGLVKHLPQWVSLPDSRLPRYAGSG